MVWIATSSALGTSVEGGSPDLLLLLQALADPSRLLIIRLLREREQCVCHLTEALQLSQGTVSHHMAVLKRAGLVLDRKDPKDARWVYYSLAATATVAGRRLADLLDATYADGSPAGCVDARTCGA